MYLPYIEWRTLYFSPTVQSGTFAYRYMKNSLHLTMCDPILVTLLKMRPHKSQSSRENATPSKGTSPLASYKGVPPPPRGLYAAFIIHWNVDHNSLSWVNGMCLLKFLIRNSIGLLKVFTKNIVGCGNALLGFFVANGLAKRGLLSRRAWIAHGPLKACFDPCFGYKPSWCLQCLI